MPVRVHLSPSERLVFEELQAHPETRYQRSCAELRELAREHGYTLEGLANALRPLVNKGYISEERVGRNIDFFCSPDETGVTQSGEKRRFSVGFSRGEDGYVIASVPALPGCHSQGRTIEEARLNIREAMQGYLASLKFLGEPIPAEEMVEQVEVSV